MVNWTWMPSGPRVLRMTDKPAFKVPLMATINAHKGYNGLTAASTFSGTGGNSTGIKWAGFDLRYASEFIPSAQESYRANHPGTFLDGRDIRITQPEDILKAANLRAGELDLLDGSPPCSSFSTSGKRDKGWGEPKSYSDGVIQRTDDLFWEYIRVMGGLRPKVFIAENVTGLVKGSAVGHFKEFIVAMQKHGYRVRAGLLNGAWCGVPQARERILYLGVREDLGVDPTFPKPLPYHYTVRDGWAGLSSTVEEVAECVHLKSGHFLHTAWHMTMPGDNFIPAAQRMKGRASYFDYRRLGWHLPAPTIKATSGGLFHPDVPRSCTIPELRRLSGLPDDFQLKGSYEQRWERCGRLVPPPMYYHLARHVRDVILGWKGVTPDYARTP